MDLEGSDLIRAVVLGGEDGRDLAERHAGLAQQQDPLQARHGRRPVVAVAVGADPIRGEEPDLVVVTHGPSADPGALGALLDRPLHHALPFQPPPTASPNRGSANDRISSAGTVTLVAAVVPVSDR